MTEIIDILKQRFEANMHRHEGFEWSDIASRLENNTSKLRSLSLMEKTGGEPDVVDYDKEYDVYIFMDCAPETPKGRRSLCYDAKALEERKKHKPEDSAMNMAEEMGVQLLNEKQYRMLQALEPVDQKTSTWLLTPHDIRKHGGAIFGDRRYHTVFIYHNGADSYYGSRGFRSFIHI